MWHFQNSEKKHSEKGNTLGPFLKIKTMDADLIFIIEFLDKYHNKKKVLGCKTFFTCSNITQKVIPFLTVSLHVYCKLEYSLVF